MCVFVTERYNYQILKQICWHDERLHGLQNNRFLGCELGIHLGCSKSNLYIQNLVSMFLREEGRQLLGFLIKCIDIYKFEN